MFKKLATASGPWIRILCSPRSQFVAMVGVAWILSLWLCWPNLAESLWVDELHTSWTVNGKSLFEIALRAWLGNQLPVWFLFESLVRHGFGESELSLRAISMISHLATMTIAAWVVANTPAGFRMSAALVCLSWMILDSFAIFYATEARPYATLRLAAIMSVCGLGQGKPSALVKNWSYGCALMASLMHPVGLLIPFGYLAGKCWNRVDREATPRLWLVAFTIAAIPSFCLMLQVFPNRHDWSGDWSDVAISKLFDIGPLYPSCLFSIGVVAIDRYLKRTSNEEPQSTLSPMIVFFTAPILLAFLVNGLASAPLVSHRYLFPFTAGAAILPALILARVSESSLRWIGTAFLVGWAIVANPTWRSRLNEGRAVQDRFANEDWRGATALLNERLESQRMTTVYVRANLYECDRYAFSADAAEREYCVLPSLSLYRLKAEKIHTVPVPSSAELLPRLELRSAFQVGETSYLVARGTENSNKLYVDAFVTKLQSEGVAIGVKRHAFGKRLSVFELQRASGPNHETPRHLPEP